VISYKLDVLQHVMGIHANQGYRKGLVDEISLDFYSACNDTTYNHWCSGVEETFVVDVDSKAMVEAFVTRDEFIGKGETGKEAVFLEPKDSTESAIEEDAFDGSKCNKTFSKIGCFRVGLLVDDACFAGDQAFRPHFLLKHERRRALEVRLGSRARGARGVGRPGEWGARAKPSGISREARAKPSGISREATREILICLCDIQIKGYIYIYINDFYMQSTTASPCDNGGAC